ncbi:MAG: hypothetical protein Fur0042_14230 [Cyanophyceae cyanobacterium]
MPPFRNCTTSTGVPWPAVRIAWAIVSVRKTRWWQITACTSPWVLNGRGVGGVAGVEGATEARAVEAMETWERGLKI